LQLIGFVDLLQKGLRPKKKYLARQTTAEFTKAKISERPDPDRLEGHPKL
jgi:hypothetical protein